MHHSEFVHLHLHTYYSLLDGACPIGRLADRVHELKMPAVAMTDHGNLFGAVEFYQTMSKKGIKPVVGCEAYLLTAGDHRVKETSKDGFLSHLILLARDREGYRHLCHLVSAAHLHGFYYKPRMDKTLLQEHAKGLIALSGCVKGEIPTLLARGDREGAKRAAEFYARLFGEDHFYIELNRHRLPQQDNIQGELITLAREVGLPLVATNDVHYLKSEEALAQDALVCIRTGETLEGTKRLKLAPAGRQRGMEGEQFYLKSAEEMRELFADVPEAVANTVTIAEKCNLEFDFNTYYFPKFHPPEKKDLMTYLAELSREGLNRRLAEIAARRKGEEEGGTAVYEERLRHELEMIRKTGFAGYFLIVADFIQYAKSRGVPVGPGRGSAAGSLVAYCLGITDIDPIEHKLLFERFLNPERVTQPDMDIDFCMRRREEVLEYVAQKYGHVSQIITFGKMKARAVIRDVGRVMGLPYGEVDRIAKLIPNTLGITLDRAVEVEPQLKELSRKDDQVSKLLEIAKMIEGFPRHASTHAAGVVISDEPLENHLPLYRGQHDEIVTQYDMKAVEKVGLIKFDFLGLKTLTVIADTLALVEKNHGARIDLQTLGLDDPAVFENLSRGDTPAVFQLESSGMTDLVVRLKPNRFDDLTALVALFRPGPLGSGMVDDFINRKHGRIAIRYELPELKEILEETYGVILYQEQVMKIASVLANFSLGDADLLRRAMGKKIHEEMARQRQKFLEGAAKNKIPAAKAEKIFDLMAKFAEYGFNRSHSAAYALIAYHTAWLKTHYPTEYMASVLTVESNNTDKVVFYLQEAGRQAIEILPPDVNESELRFSVVGEKKIRFGLGAIKNVGEAAIEQILESRSQDGPFHSLFDFCERVDSRKANRRVLEALVKCGAMDGFGARRSQLMAALDSALDIGSKKQKERQSGQFSLLDRMRQAPGGDILNRLPDVDDWPERQRLQFEKEGLGFYLSGHPLAHYENLLQRYATADTATVQELGDKREVRVGGMAASLRITTTKKGDRMGFVTLEDLKGTVDVVVFPETFKKAHPLLQGERPILVLGTVDEQEESNKIIANDILPLDEVPKHLTRNVHFRLSSAEATPKQLGALKSILSRHPGPCKAYLHLAVSEKAETVLSLPDELKVDPSPQMVEAVTRLFGHPVISFQG